MVGGTTTASGVERNAKVVSISSHGDLNLEGNPRPGFPAPTRQLSLAYVVIPRMNRTGDEIGAFQAREYLRRTLVGKQVTFTVAYTIPSTQREFGQVSFNGKDVAETMLREGLIKFREDASKKEDVNQAVLETYMVAEAQARSENKGLWSASLAAIDVQQEQPDTKAFLAQHQGKKIDAIIEQVRAGDSVRARLILEPSSHQFLNLLLAGIRCPAPSRNKPDEATEKAEEYGEEARTFVEARLNQRSVQVLLLGTNQNATGFVASIHHPAGNIAEALLSNGLARVVDYQSTMIGGPGMTKLRQAESAAKQRRQNIWRSHVPKQSVASGSFGAIVSRVLSADTVFVRTKDGKERRLQMSSIRGPRMTDAKQALFAPEAKEFLRKKVIGKHVNVVIDFKKPASEGFEERDLATITLASRDNLAKVVVEKGYATVIRHRKDDEDRSAAWDELLAAEELAISQQKGMHSSKDPVAVGRIVEASESVARAKQYLSTLQRSKRIPAVVDFVSSGGRFKLFLPRENAKLTFVLSGLRVPKTARNASEASEPMGVEALEYASRRLLQRDIEIEVETVERIGGFVGSLYINRENFAVGLLEEGLANVHDYSADQAGLGTLYREAEHRAKEAKKGVYINYDPAKEQEKERLSGNEQNGTIAAPPAKREYLDLVITDVDPVSGSFSYQIVGEGVKSLEKLMGEMQSSYESANQPSTTPKVGDTVAAKFTEDDAWYRAKVKRVDRATLRAEILYYDYGNSELIDFKRLTPLTSKFTSLPAQAKEARLSFVELPDNAEYRADAMAHFQTLCQKQLVASVDKKDGGLTYLSLYDPDNQDSSDTLNAAMVQEGWATVKAAKNLTWEKAYGTSITSMRAKQTEAQQRHRGMFEFGDSTGYDD